MTQPNAAAPFHVQGTYDKGIIEDFQALYARKKRVSPALRVLFGLVGAVGSVYFGWMLYQEGLSITRVGYMVICAILLLVAISGGRMARDDSPQRYEKAYLGKKVVFDIDERGLTMKLSSSKNPAFSKFKEFHALYETEKCFYFVIKGKAYYIVPKAGLSSEAVKALASYMEKKCAKQMISY